MTLNTFALLELCDGNQITDGLHSQRAQLVTRSFDVFLCVCCRPEQADELMKKQSSCRGLETPWHSYHYNDTCVKPFHKIITVTRSRIGFHNCNKYISDIFYNTRIVYVFLYKTLRVVNLYVIVLKGQVLIWILSKVLFWHVSAECTPSIPRCLQHRWFSYFLHSKS